MPSSPIPGDVQVADDALNAAVSLSLSLSLRQMASTTSRCAIYFNLKYFYLFLHIFLDIYFHFLSSSGDLPN